MSTVKTFEKELKAQKIKLRASNGVLNTTAYKLLQEMKPTEYTGKIEVPDKCTGIMGVAILNQLAQRYSEGRFEVILIKNGVYAVKSKLYTVATITPTLVGEAIIFASDSLEEVAKYLRKVWCIPFEEVPIPDSIDKLNKWLHDYGASDINVKNYGGIIEFTYKIDGNYPSHASDREYHQFSPFDSTPEGCKEFAEWICIQRPQLIKCWLNAESDIQREKDEANSIIARNLQMIGGSGTVCRVVVKCDDGSFILQDTNYQTKQFRKEELKELIRQGDVRVVDLQVSKDNKLVKKHVDLKKLCRKHDYKSPLTPQEQRAILFCGLAYINTCMKPETKQKYCNEIKATGGMDANDLISLFIHNKKWNWEHYCKLDTACRDKVMDSICEIVK